MDLARHEANSYCWRSRVLKEIILLFATKLQCICCHQLHTSIPWFWRIMKMDKKLLCGSTSIAFKLENELKDHYSQKVKINSKAFVVPILTANGLLKDSYDSRQNRNSNLLHILFSIFLTSIPFLNFCNLVFLNFFNFIIMDRCL